MAKRLTICLVVVACLAVAIVFERSRSNAQVRTTPRRHNFVPTRFYREFSATTPPVLHIAPGDTVHTTSIDAAGTDERGMNRAPAGNPLTGPFYIRDALPGDAVAVHLTRLRLNREWAVSGDTLSIRGLTPELLPKMTYRGQIVRWRLDVQGGVASRENPSQNLAGYVVPIRPMLGCVGLAPKTAGNPPDTGEVGAWGGNMDFNEVVEGTTVYLPVSVPGGLLYVGDGHAAQGDGELNASGLETSMEIEFSVRLLPRHAVSAPRLESTTHVMAMGLSDSLDSALQYATSNMADWLMQQYRLTSSEVAQVLGTSAEYRVSLVVGKNAGIVLKIDKQRLAALNKVNR